MAIGFIFGEFLMRSVYAILLIFFFTGNVNAEERRSSGSSSRSSAVSSQSSSASDSDHEQELLTKLDLMRQRARQTAKQIKILLVRRQVKMEGIHIDALTFQQDEDFTTLFNAVPPRREYAEVIELLDRQIKEIHQLKRELKGAVKAARSERREHNIMIVAQNEPCWFIRPWDKKSSYDADDVNFTGDIQSVDITTANWTVLVNMHANVPLIWGGKIPKGENRSYGWAVPYHIAVNAFKETGDVHTKSALPLAWSRGKYRNMVSFLLIPPLSRLTFKIGYAKPQADSTYAFDRLGWGVQMRLKEIPAGTIIITEPLVLEQQLGREKEFKAINLPENLAKALHDFNESDDRNNAHIPEISLNKVIRQKYYDIDGFIRSLSL